MNNKYVISFFSIFHNKFRYYKGILSEEHYSFGSSQKLLNSTGNIKEAIIYTNNKEKAIEDMIKIKIKFNFNTNEIRVEDISEYTPYTRWEIMDI